MRKKGREIFLTMAAFGILIYLGHHTYLLEWLARRYFCFLWVPILVFWLFRQEILARWVTFGALGGMFLGQIGEDVKWMLHGTPDPAAHSSYWGVGIWLVTVVVSLGIGILLTWLKLARARKEAS